MSSGGYLQHSSDHLDINLLQRFYGIDGDISHPSPGTTGAGASGEDSLFPPLYSLSGDAEDDGKDYSNLSEQELATLSFIQEQLTSQQEKHVRHPPIKVPRHETPFSSTEQEDVFWEAVEDANGESYIPGGYGVVATEWEQGVYPEIEAIRSGSRRCGELEISLPSSVWFPWAVRWAQALHIMRFCFE